MKHLVDIINERFTNGYYNSLPPFTYSRDAASVCYLLGYCSKIDYNVIKAKYEWANSKEYITPLIIL
jgi:hypothetical protein